MGFWDIFRRKKKTESEEQKQEQTEAQSVEAKEPEVSPGGSLIYRHEAPAGQELHPPKQYGLYMKEIESHFKELFPDRDSFVFHELESDLVHIDVHLLGPGRDAPYYVLFTTGMSDLPMTLPDPISGREDLKYAELFLFLPNSWNFGESEQDVQNLPESSFWPIRLLKFLARFPHEYRTWLGWGHTIPNGPDYSPLTDDAGFGGVVLAQPSDIPPMETKDQKKINFYIVIPAYKEEIEYKLKYGMEALGQRFLEGHMPFVLDIHRPNLCEDFTEVLDAL